MYHHMSPYSLDHSGTAPPTSWYHLASHGGRKVQQNSTTFLRSSATILCSKEDFNNSQTSITTNLKEWSITILILTGCTAPLFANKIPHNAHMSLTISLTQKSITIFIPTLWLFSLQKVVDNVVYCIVTMSCFSVSGDVMLETLTHMLYTVT